jgi:hypothetical protein
MKKLLLLTLLFISVNLFAEDNYSQKWQNKMQENQTNFQNALDAYNQRLYTNELVKHDSKCQETQSKIDTVLKHMADPEKHGLFEGYLTEYNRLIKILEARIKFLTKTEK